jgi:ParB family chromosome partitioning protein
MSKRDELMKGLPNVRESMGDFAAVRGAPPVGPRALPPHLMGVVRSRDVSEIAIDRIVRDPAQPRVEFDQEGLERLAQSLRQRGQLQPIQVRWEPSLERYVIVCGERRWRAAGMAKINALACVIVEKELSPQERLAVQLVENALREDLRPIEQAKAYRALIQAQGWSVRQLAAELSIHHAQVVRALALLELPAPTQDLVEQGKLSPATAYEANKVDDPGARQELLDRAAAEGLSRAEVIEARREITDRTAGPSGKGRGASKARPPKPRTFARLRAGKGHVEPKAPGLEGIRAVIVEMLEVVDAEIEAKGRAGEVAA